jgi:hypothetical protein
MIAQQTSLSQSDQRLGSMLNHVPIDWQILYDIFAQERNSRETGQRLKIEKINNREEKLCREDV